VNGPGKAASRHAVLNQYFSGAAVLCAGAGAGVPRDEPPALHCIACEMNGRGVRERERASNTAGAGTAHTLSLSVSAHSHTPRRHCLASHETVPRTHPNTLHHAQSVPYRALREACAAPPPAILRRDTPITRLRLVSSLASPFPIAIDNLPNLLMFDRSQPNTALPIHSTHRRTVATKRRIEN
jgi:hypothetical protein